MNIKLTADSTCDLSEELIKQLDLSIINFFVTLGNKDYRDGIDVFPHTIYDFVEKNKLLPKTAAPSIEEYSELWKRYCGDYDAIIHFNISSKLSAGNQNAVIAAKNFDNVYVIDSLSLSTGTSLLILYADKLRKEGKPAAEIVETLNGLRNKVVASFVVDTLDYLHKGGRCSGLAHFAASILKLHPMLLLSDGTITVHKKLRGNFKKVCFEYINLLNKEFSNYQDDFAFITTTCDEDEIEEIKAKVKSIFNFKNIHITSAGSTVTSHCGKGTYGLLFINKTPI
ncbi:MAG: DegV family protein [Clostridia bacterium]|nr:DegV family protein [Clostridia bacterium]